jgi:ferrous iron transport protein A
MGLMPLSQVPEGARVWVNCLPLHPELQRRLLAMGVRPGVEIEVLRRGHPGGLLHLASGLTEFMLRRAQAADMQVTLIPPG